MNTKLEVIRLTNEDVIATSACKDAFGVIRIQSINDFEAYKNGNTGAGSDYSYPAYQFLNYQEQTGTYHFTISGNKIIIGEKCPYDDTEAYNEHDVTYGY